MIGIDIDTTNAFTLLKAYFNAKHFGQVEPLRTGHGYHLKIKSKTRSPWTKMQIRLTVGDCRGRLHYDDLMFHAGMPEITDTLFVYKARHGGKFEMEQPFNPLSEPFWNARCSRIKHRRWNVWSRKRQLLQA